MHKAIALLTFIIGLLVGILGTNSYSSYKEAKKIEFEKQQTLEMIKNFRTGN